MSNLETELFLLLAQATKRNKIPWEGLQGDCYCAEGNGRSYFLDWLYWYDTTSITIGRMGLVLAFRNIAIRVVWGTAGMEAGKELLKAIHSEWSDHFGKMSKECHKMIEVQPPVDPVTPDSKQPWITTLRLLLEAAKQGKMKWVRHSSNPNRFYAAGYQNRFEITLFSPIDGEEKPTYNLFANFEIPGSQLGFVSGTDGFFLIEELLAFCFEDYRSQREATQFALATEIAFLKSLIESPH